MNEGYCRQCELIVSVVVDHRTDAKTRALFTNLACAECGAIMACLEGHVAIQDKAILAERERCAGVCRELSTSLGSHGCDAYVSGWVDALVAAAASWPGGATIAFYTGDPPATPDEEPTGEKFAELRTDATGAIVKSPTVLEEVYRLADAGMEPGQISAELAKAGVTLHRLAIAKKLKERKAC